MKWIRGSLRLVFWATMAIYYISRYLIGTIFWGPDVDRGIRLRKSFIHLFFPMLGVQIDVRGAIPKGGGLLVCNHRSYVDPFVVLRDVPAMPVGKAEVKKWPIIGIAGRVSGAIFVDRSSEESRRKARQDITQAIKDGYFIINYPEGTTHSEPQTNAFKPGMFRDAAKEGFPIYPVALEYQQEDDHWVGDDTFIRHFLACFGKQKTYVRIHYGPAISGTDTQLLLEEVQATIDHNLAPLRQNWFIANPKM